MMEKDLVDNLKRRIVFTMPYMSPLLSLPVVETDKNPATDGKVIYLVKIEGYNDTNSDGFKKMVDDYAHELVHILLRHVSMRLKAEKRNLYNICADIMVGAFLTMNSNFKPFLDRDYYDKLLGAFPIPSDLGDKLTAELLYNYYVDKVEDNKVNVPTKDDHDNWNNSSDDEEKSVVKQLVGQAIGDMPGKLKRIFILMPTRRWKVELFGTLSRFKELRKPKYGNRRYGDEYIGTYKSGKSKVLVAVDASGSVSHYFRDFVEVLSSLKGVYEYDTLIFDYGIRKFIKGVPESVEFTGGGTDVREVMDFYIEHKNEYDIMVMLTDGQFRNNYEKPNKPVLVVLTPDGSKVDSFSTIRITELY